MSSKQPTILEYLRKKRMSQVDFAKSVGWTQGHVSNVIREKRDVVVVTTDQGIELHERKIIARSVNPLE